jgi:hypothetical protein
VSHEGNIICVAKLDKYRAIASEPFRLQIANRYFIDGKLSIFGVQAADEGHFTCQATNKLLKKSIHLPIAIELKVLPTEIQNAAQTKMITYRAGADRHVILPGCGFHSSWSYSSKLVDVQYRKDAAIVNPSPSNRKLIEVKCSNGSNNVTIRYTLRPKCKLNK